MRLASIGRRGLRRLTALRAFLLVVLVAMGVGAGVAWAWASPIPREQVFHVTARQFGYDPGILRANVGDHVVILLHTADVTHGLYIDGYGVSAKVAPGQDARLSFVANRTGRFTIRCNETCGVFHPFMTGKLIVEPNALLPGSIGLAAGVAIASVLYAGWTTRREP
jgi:cytochrome c oxidase subunit 2